MTKLKGWKMACAVAVLCGAEIAAPAQTFTTLFTFNGTNGSNAIAPLVQGTDGNFYGTTPAGGGDDFAGTLFKITPEGVLTTLHNFCTQPPNCSDGKSPSGALLLAADGSFYGTTYAGGGNGFGTVFKFTPSGQFITLHSFAPSEGINPSGPLVQDANGNLYGTTSVGGAHTQGTFFVITRQGVLTTLHNFCSIPYCPDGAGPQAGVIQAGDGNFYGTTPWGGAESATCTGGCGTVFKITANGKLTTLHTFCEQASCADGAAPIAGLVQASDGDLYGVTIEGGAYGAGTAFRITLSGALSTIHNFCAQTNCTDGSGSAVALIQGDDGNFYGAAGSGAYYRYCLETCGMVFEMAKGGTLTTLHDFDGGDGEGPGSLVQDTNGILYGLTYDGAFYNDGTVFSVNTSLLPFVRLVRASGKVGNNALILGQGFTGTTGVSFDGSVATFAVGADTYLTAMVPPGATTGSVTVTTPGGPLTSNVPFRVTPQLLSFSPPSGPVGTVVTITGVSLTQTTGVGFGDYMPAPFTVNSDNQVTATVPVGAKSGRVGVQTLGGTALSSAIFTVTP